MFHVSTIKNWFKGKADDFNKIAEFLNNICGDGFVRITRPDKPSSGSPPTISLDVEKIQQMFLREDTSTGSVTDATGHFANDYDASLDEPPITPANGATDLWNAMTKDGENSTAEKTYYKGWKENAVIAITEVSGSHCLWFVEKEYTPDGRLKSVSTLKGFTLIGA